MEIMADGLGKRTVLTLFDGHELGKSFVKKLQTCFNVVVSTTPEECLDIMHERFNDLSVAIIDVDLAEQDNLKLLKSISREPNFITIPVLISTRRELNEDDMCCLEEGAIDFITRPFTPSLLSRRVENAITLKQNSTFVALETMLSELPSNIFLKDAQGRYVFQTHLWGHLDTGGDPNWTIRGKTDLDIRKDKANAKKAMEADRKIIETGVGTNYIIEENTTGKQEFLELIKRPVFDKEGNITGIIALINDVTERETLKRKLEKNLRTDELTGLGNRRSYDEYLRNLARRTDFPIAVISADCDRLKFVNDTYGHLVGDEYLHMSAAVLKTSLPENADAFRTGGDEFMIFLPGYTKTQADEIVAIMKTHQATYKLRECSISISYGTSVMLEGGDTILGAIAAADRAMYQNKAENKRMRELQEIYEH